MLQANGSSRYARLAELKADALSLDRDTLVNVVLELVMVPEETFVGADRIQVAHDAIVRERRQLENLKPTGLVQPNPYGQKSAQPNPYSVKQEALPSLEGPCAAADPDTKSVVKVKREDEQSDRKANLTNGISDFDLVRARQ
eukprot:CAMPEP_0198221852 /NCGR_PEP_ID=MMETSP1445-20131203/85560_1 /TAXON_ID=36898 /ORGANISM="Pyramimonas sp., Strain CCMP2087" /LENGTH=141 /DNA_ID=CAMNT_0043900153 /DNA_START=391 /DNA_END=813 /DNA_ORIENTATION=+